MTNAPPGPSAEERLAEVAEDDDAVTAERPKPDREVGAEDADVDRAGQRWMEGEDARPVVDRDAAGAKVRLRGPGREQRDEDEEDEGPPHLDRPADRLDHDHPGDGRRGEGHEARAGGATRTLIRRPCRGA